MSRRFPTAELYEERAREFYGNGKRSERNYEELDVDLRRGADPRRSAPDFFRDDYDRVSNSGALVMRERREDDFSSRRSSRRDVEDDTTTVRSGRSRPPPPASSVREVERDDITIRRSDDHRRRSRPFEKEEIDIEIKHRERSRSRPATDVREIEREDIRFRAGHGARPRGRDVSIERDEVRFQERGPPSRRGREEEEDITFRHEHRESSRNGVERDVHKDSLVIRGRERSLPPPRHGRLVAREREELIIRRRDESSSPSPSPPPPPVRRREVIKDEIIIRRREERSPTPEPVREPTPPPPPPPVLEPIIRPPIIQEIITHHRHIDHGVVRARSPTPPPPPPPPREPTPPPREEILEITLKRKESRGGDRKLIEEDDIHIERDVVESRGRDEEEEVDIYTRRGRSLSMPRRARTMPAESDFEVEAEFYSSRKGTTDRVSSKAKPKDMWTEITKDLVIKEAIDSLGYAYEETDEYFYIMDYLQYDHVHKLVDLSDELRRKRRSRIRQIEFDGEEIRSHRPEWDEKFYERDVIRSRYR